MNTQALNVLIQKSIAGDKTAFGEIMEDYSDYVYALAFRILLNEDDAKDIVQESFIKIWKNIHTYRSEVKFTTWIYKITTNLCFDHLRKQKRRDVSLTDGGMIIDRLISEDHATVQPDIEEIRALLTKLSGNLSNKQRIVFVLQDLQGLHPDELETITGLSKGQIKSNLYYARKSIKDQLIRIGYEL
jgi:RNA polymerase sigma-70 factor (ECF subfamily)